jgi:hypothetical protein
VSQNGRVRALLDLLVALRGTVTVTLRRTHPAVLVGAGLGAAALVAGAVHVLGDDGAPGGSPRGYELGAPDDAGGGAPGAPGGDELPAGDPLVNVLGARPADPRSPGAGAASADAPGSDAAGATGPGGTASPATPPSDDEAGGATVPGTATGAPSTPPGPSAGSAPPPSTTTTEAPADPADTDGGDGDGSGGVLGGLLDVLGLG